MVFLIANAPVEIWERIHPSGIVYRAVSPLTSPGRKPSIQMWMLCNGTKPYKAQNLDMSTRLHLANLWKTIPKLESCNDYLLPTWTMIRITKFMIDRPLSWRKCEWEVQSLGSFLLGSMHRTISPGCSLSMNLSNHNKYSKITVSEQLNKHKLCQNQFKIRSTRFMWGAHRSVSPVTSRKLGNLWRCSW